jgi:outer membrane receptor for ferrienterochelin and colicin
MRISRTVWVAPSTCYPLSPAGRRFDARRLSIIFLLFALPAVAQETTKDLGTASLEELGNIQVYSASKHMQSASDAPSSVTVITADEIQKYGYHTLADILETVRGFYITYDRDYSFVGVRGFGRLGDWNSRVLVLVDGHRINNNIDGQAMLGTEFLVDVDLIDRVEIIRGHSTARKVVRFTFAPQ